VIITLNCFINNIGAQHKIESWEEEEWREIPQRTNSSIENVVENEGNEYILVLESDDKYVH
jgi:hypothetical protein